MPLTCVTTKDLGKVTACEEMFRQGISRALLIYWRHHCIDEPKEYTQDNSVEVLHRLLLRPGSQKWRPGMSRPGNCAAIGRAVAAEYHRSLGDTRDQLKAPLARCTCTPAILRRIYTPCITVRHTASEHARNTRLPSRSGGGESGT
ncbi:hypothetical protein J6590_004604 [Homalodisca vitripennis]|nr:hypothetical protein J6590_004604 [Homalodisca vitripennis]